MESKFGRGFVIPLVALSRHFALPPEKAFLGAADHLTELTLPGQFKGTRVEELLTHLRTQVIWHQPGVADAKDAEAVKKTLNRLLVEIDRGLGIDDPQVGVYE
ncbi:hypothetical protein J2129_001289 [Methanofollis sp. W23]|nr:hypothetical protein [Methanofollis sp. W23]MBP2145835.1 hypothetical protein [Methanofollis sp. W23]